MIESIFIFLFAIAGVATFAWALRGIGIEDEDTFVKIGDGVINLNKVTNIYVTKIDGVNCVKFVLENGNSVWTYYNDIEDAKARLAKIAQLTGAIDIDELVKLDELEEKEERKELAHEKIQH